MPEPLARHVSFAAEAADVAELHAARTICYLVGSYDGSANYGDVLQLAASLQRVRRVPGVQAVALVSRRYAASHARLVAAHPALFEGTRFLYYLEEASGPEACGRTGPEAGDRLTQLLGAPSAAPTLLLYGGGFLNDSFTWGRHKLDVIAALDEWIAVGTGGERAPLIVTGQQIGADVLEVSPGGSFRRVLERASSVGVRDDLSLTHLRQSGGSLADTCYFSADDAATLLLTAPQSETEDGGDRTGYTVNVHVSAEDYVSSSPGRMLDTFASLLLALDDSHGSTSGLEVNLIIGYDDDRVSERGYVAQLQARLAGSRIRSRLLHALDDYDVGFKALRRADLTVACSYHVALSSLLLAVPVVLIRGNGYYSHKHHGLAALFGLPESVLIDVEFANDEDLRTAIDVATTFTVDRSRVLAAGLARTSVGNDGATARLAAALAETSTASVTARQRRTVVELGEALAQLSDLKGDYARVMRVLRTTPRAQTGGTAYDYAGVVTALHEAVQRHVPPQENVVVISRGDPDLLNIPERRCGHFPQTADGVYAGHHPATDDDAVGQLRRVMQEGVDYLVVPATALWWLDHYPYFADVIALEGELISETHAGNIYALNKRAALSARRALAASLRLELAAVETEISDREALNARTPPGPTTEGCSAQ